MNFVTSFLISSTLILVPVFNSGPVEIYQAPVATSTPVVVAVKPTVRAYKPFAPLTATQVEIASKVEEVFGESMVTVVKCESNFRQFDATGNTLRSPTSDVGVMQINQVHWARAKSLGLDIFNSVDDNIIMGKIIFDEQGHDAWTCHNMVAGST